jgi:NADH dehydrogenase
MTFERLVRAIREAIGSRAPIVHAPTIAMAALARALGLVVHDVVLTPDEIKGLTAGLLVSHHPPLGRVAFTDWLREHGASIGRSYANELRRHFVPQGAR